MHQFVHLALLGCLCVAGCVQPQSPPFVYVAQDTGCRAAAPNLLLAADPERAWLAETFLRRAWPVVDTGLRLDDVTRYTEFQLDDQSFFDEFGGFGHWSESTRSGVEVK